MNAQATSTVTRAAFTIALIALFGSLCVTIAEPAPEVTSVSRTEGGLIRLELPLPATKYAILHRADGLTGTGRAIAVARPVDGTVTLIDPAPIPASGFLEVHVHNTTSPADTDGDGTNDLVELSTRPSPP